MFSGISSLSRHDRSRASAGKRTGSDGDITAIPSETRRLFSLVRQSETHATERRAVQRSYALTPVLRDRKFRSGIGRVVHVRAYERRSNAGVTNRSSETNSVPRSPVSLSTTSRRSNGPPLDERRWLHQIHQRLTSSSTVILASRTLVFRRSTQNPGSMSKTRTRVNAMTPLPARSRRVVTDRRIEQ